jgi:hypothetical protein
MANRLLTVDEANALVPALELHFGNVMQLRAQLRDSYETLEQLGEPPTPQTLLREAGPEKLVTARGRFRALMEALTEELAAIEETGATVKDLDLGLCDFLGRCEGREVWLCWQYGEKRVGFWHELDAGFAARRPLTEASQPHRLLH